MLRWSVDSKKLNNIGKFVGSEQYKPIGVHDVVFKSVLPFLEAIGYEIDNPQEVKLDVPYFEGDFKVHVQANLCKKPVIVVRVVDFNEDTAKEKSSILNVLKSTEANVGILTDGVRYTVYFVTNKENGLAYHNIWNIDLSNLSERALELCSYCLSGYLSGDDAVSVVLVRRENLENCCKKLTETLFTGNIDGVPNWFYRALVREAGCPEVYCKEAERILKRLKEF